MRCLSRFIVVEQCARFCLAYASVLEMPAANGVDVMIAGRDEFTPTPVISHAILAAYDCGRDHGLAHGIVITPSHALIGGAGLAVPAKQPENTYTKKLKEKP